MSDESDSKIKRARGVRINAMHSEAVRQRIKTSYLVNALTNYVRGTRKMEPAQVTAALGLLKKTIPDIQAIEHIGEIEHRHHVVQAEPLTEEAWQRTYGQAPQRLDG